jgi:PAS domain S-box-containing protein
MPLNRLDLVFNALPGNYLLVLPNPPLFTIAGFNQARAMATNSTNRQILGKNLFEVFPDNPDDPDATGVKNLTASFMKVIETRKRHRMPLQKYDIPVPGSEKFEERYWRPENIPVFDEEGKMICIIHSVTDVTSEVLLHTSEANYRYLFNHNPASSIIWNACTFRILDVNQTACDTFGYSMQELVQKTVFDIRPEDEHSRTRNLANYIRLGTPIENTDLWKMLRKDGKVLYMQLYFHKTIYQNSEAVLVLGNDVTEKIMLQQRLKEEKDKAILEMTNAVLMAQEIERKNISLELHDNIIQILSTAKLLLDHSFESQQASVSGVRQSHELIGTAIYELRSLAESLNPPWLAEGSFIQALSDLFQRIQSLNKIYIETDFCIDEDGITPRQKIDIFRIIQEQLNNIVKYSHAQKALVSIVSIPGQVHIKVKDDGKGFDPKSKTDGFGFRNMISRAQIHNGNVLVRSAPGEGCEVLAVLNNNNDGRKH